MLHRMPTQNPRITVTLTPAVAAVLKRMSELTGNSQSALVGDLLEESRPVFDRMVLVLQAAKDVKGKVQSDIVASMEGIQARLEKQLGLGLDVMDDGARPLLEEAERINRRGGRSAGGERPPRQAEPPRSNRGVTPHARKATKKGNPTGETKGTGRGQV